MKKALMVVLLLLAGAVAARAQSRGVSVFTNRPEISYPKDFWQYNLGLTGTANVFEVEGIMQDIAEATGDSMIPDYLGGYLPSATAQYMFYPLSARPPAAEIPYVSAGLLHLSGGDVQAGFRSVDARLADLYQRVATLQTSSPPSLSSATVTASSVLSGYIPSAYSTTNSSVEAHLGAIDGALVYLLSVLGGTNLGVTNAFLTNVICSGAATVDENSAAAYAATAQFSDGTSTDVTLAAGTTFAVLGAPSGVLMETNILRVGSLAYSTNVQVAAWHVYRGLTKGGSLAVALNDLSASSITNLAITGDAEILNTSPIQRRMDYSAFAQYSDGRAVDVTSLASWMTNTVFDRSTGCYSVGRSVFMTDSAWFPFYPEVTNNMLAVSNLVLSAVYQGVTGACAVSAYGNMPVSMRKTSDALLTPDSLFLNTTNDVMLIVKSAQYPSGLDLPAAAITNWISSSGYVTVTNGRLWVSGSPSANLPVDITAQYNYMMKGQSCTKTVMMIAAVEPIITLHDIYGGALPTSYKAQSLLGGSLGMRAKYTQGSAVTWITRITGTTWAISDLNTSPSKAKYTAYIGYPSGQEYVEIRLSPSNPNLQTGEQIGPFEVTCSYSFPGVVPASKQVRIYIVW